MEKQDVKIEQIDFKDYVVKSVEDTFKCKCLYDMHTIKIENVYPDQAEIRANSNENIRKLIDEYKKFDNKNTKDILREVLLENQEILTNEILPHPEIFDSKKLPENTPERLKELLFLIQKISYLQNIFIHYSIKDLLEETMIEDADWFINFSKENKEKIDTFDMAWNIYMVLTCIVPFRTGYFNVPYDFKFMNDMSEIGKTIPDFFVKLSQEFGFITEEEANLAYDYLKNRNNDVN